MTDNTWFNSYIPTLKAMGLKPDPEDTSGDGSVTSFYSAFVGVEAVKAYFKRLGFVNTDARTYMRHTGRPHINLEKDGRVVQVIWRVNSFWVGVSFLAFHGELPQ